MNEFSEAMGPVLKLVKENKWGESAFARLVTNASKIHTLNVGWHCSLKRKILQIIRDVSENGYSSCKLLYI